MSNTKKAEKNLALSNFVPSATFPEEPKGILAAGFGKVSEAIMTTMVTGKTVRIFGLHGIGKTALTCQLVPAVANFTLGLEDVRTVVIPAATIGPDDLIAAAPVRDPEAKAGMILVEVISTQLLTHTKGEKFVLVVDDPLMATPMMQNQLMQMSAEWKLGGFDLREHGCVGAIFLDNPTLAEANSVMDDLAQADRFIVKEITDQDTAFETKLHLASKYKDIDLTAVFAVRDSLPADLRYILSWRTFDQMIEVMLAGFPGHWALPYVGGSYAWLDMKDGKSGKSHNRTPEIIDRMAKALGVPYREKIDDPVRKLIAAAIRFGWSIRLVGPHGVGKTELVRSEVKKHGMKLEVLSLPVTDFDALICPVPTIDGRLEMLLTSRLTTEEEKVIFIDEASRAKDLLTYARGNELIHEHSLGGQKIPALRAVIAAENPPEFLGHKYDVSEGTIAHADRYEATLVMDASDVPFYEWLQKDLAPQLAEAMPIVYGHKVDEIKVIAEIATEWHREDLDDSSRPWISPRNLERIIVSAANGLPLEDTKIWLGPGERAPVPMSLLMARLSGRQMTGLTEILANLDSWLDRLDESSQTSDVGMADQETVHNAFMNADLDRLWDNCADISALAVKLEPRFRVAWFTAGEAERHKFWMTALGFASKRLTAADVKAARPKKS